MKNCGDGGRVMAREALVAAARIPGHRLFLSGGRLAAAFVVGDFPNSREMMCFLILVVMMMRKREAKGGFYRFDR